MEKQKKWQLYLIIAVIALTIYNILPTVFFYSKPLKSPIDAKRSQTIATQIVDRINALEPQAKEWLDSFCTLLEIKPVAVSTPPKQPQFVSITFKSTEDANRFRHYLPRAGALIPFVPAQLNLYDPPDTANKTVLVQRRVPVHFDSKDLENYTQFSEKFDAKNNPTKLYRALVEDRAIQLGIALAGTTENALFVQALSDNRNEGQFQEIVNLLSQNILSFTRVYGESSPIANRYFSTFTQIENGDRSSLIQNFIKAIDSCREKIKTEKAALKEEGEQLKIQGLFLETVKQQRIELLTSREKTLDLTSAILKRNTQAFTSGKAPMTYTYFADALQNKSADKIQTVSLQGCNPYIEQLCIDWNNEKIDLTLYSDAAQMRKKLDEARGQASLRDQADQLLYNEIAMVSRRTGEEISPYQNQFEIALSRLNDSKSFLAICLSSIASAQTQQLLETLKTTWHPQHPDLIPSSFPVYDYDTYSKLSPSEQNFGLVVYAPALNKKTPPQGFRMNSIYVIAKGMDKFLQRLKTESESHQTNLFIQDFNSLRDILQRNGFVGYSGGAYALSPEFTQDFIFEGEDYYQIVLKATREDFSVHGTKRYAVLEYTDVEQRILTENKIDSRTHEDLLKWRDDYHAAQLNIRGVSKFDVPKPTSNVLWNNFKLSGVKYFRGDDRKILHWGLDLSGGKTVQIELRDSNNRVVANEADIKQGINELYRRVNKMGVSEVSIRQEGNYITVDFPSSQGMSAKELIKASSMYFHVVNEKFGPNNVQLADASNRFLQQIWNEAVVTNRKEVEDLNQIAWKHLYGDSLDPEVIQPRSESARILYENGMRLANPQETAVTGAYNDAFCKIALFRGDDFTNWQGQTHPLIIVFRNFALEGSNLENIQASYDPSKGNYLAFSIRGSYTNKEGVKFNPRDELFAWTSQYAKEKISGSVIESLSNAKGWRMAVILNGSIISAPTLDSALMDSAMISGSFTQREITQLEADLKAGSLSFTPHILSEKNVSPELGSKERSRGIVATILSLTLVMAVMIGYYRFGGVVASLAVLFNLFLMWATLQNLQATMTLAGIAGIILTLGMAVDANVLVFERIREEFAVSGRIASAVHAGYRKAFSAILDSNVTTIIAAMILLHFDSGPIKAFAVMLIIGIISSMFTALFMTRFFFAGWVQNPQNKNLTMLNWFKAKNYNFLKHTKKTVIFSAVIILVGCFMLITQRHTLFGMDFSGGYALSIELQANEGQANYRQAVEEALLKQGAISQDFQVRELTPSNNIRIFLSRSLQQPGHPFFGMPIENDLQEPLYRYELNPKIVWTVNALNKANLEISPSSLQNLDKSWTEVSGQISDAMRNNAIIGLAIAMLCILLYITFRFEFKYAISATICIVHDVVFTVGVLGIMHALGVSIQIDLNTVAALMTIVGYSLNDTIIVFDRIREDTRLMRKSSFSDVINHALNVTLSRTMMTSGTTLLVLIPLILLGNNTLFGFSLVMAVGVIFGTLSSLFIAAPLMKYFHDKEMQKEGKMVVNER
jgi:SecD/SecF fusion protein